MKQMPSNNLKLLTVNNIMTAIDNYDYDVKDMDRLYDDIREAQEPIEAINTDLDDLIFVSMKMAFLEGVKYQRKMESLFSMKYE